MRQGLAGKDAILDLFQVRAKPGHSLGTHCGAEYSRYVLSTMRGQNRCEGTFSE